MRPRARVRCCWRRRGCYTAAKRRLTGPTAVLRRRYPTVQARPQQALVVSGEGQRLVMAGGGTSCLDLALHLIARRTGVEAAMQVARINLIDWHDIGYVHTLRLEEAKHMLESRSRSRPSPTRSATRMPA